MNRGALLILSVLAVSCQRPAPSPPPPVEAGVVTLTNEGIRNGQVRTEKASPSNFAPRLTTVATLEPDPACVARVGARVAGRVSHIDVRLGQQVKADEPLLEVEAAETHQVSSEYLTALARSRQANDALARQRMLVNERVGAVQDLRSAEANAEAANVVLSESKEHLAFLGLSSRAIEHIREGVNGAGQRSVVRAPIAGRVAALNVALGQVIVGTEDALTIVSSDELWATLSIYERDLAGIQVGTPVALHVTSYPDRAFDGVVQVIGEVVDPVTHTFEARVRLSNADSALKPGMTATASLQIHPSGSTLWLPAEAVQSHGGGPVVFEHLDGGRFKVIPVSVGPERSGFVPIQSGIAEGTQVVVHGAFALRGELERADLQGD